MFKNYIMEGAEARAKLRVGTETIGRMVGSTLGPAGRNFAIQRKYKAPLITNDGVTGARYTYLDDPIEDIAAQTIVEVALKTNEQAGDGTTTSVVIASELSKQCFDTIAEDERLNAGVLSRGVDAMQLMRDIEEAKNIALGHLKEQAKEVKDTDIDNIIATSLENAEFGKTIGEMMREVGPDGHISVEDNYATKYGVETKVTTGMKFLATYASPYLANSSNQKEAKWEKTMVLVTNEQMNDIGILQKLLKDMAEQKKYKLVIINGYSSGTQAFSTNVAQALTKWLQAYAEGKLGFPQILAVKAPSLTTDELEDIAAFCGTTFSDTGKGMELKDIGIGSLGTVEQVFVDEEDTYIVGGSGNAEARIATLKEQRDQEKDHMFKNKLTKRIASLASGVGVIKVGAATETEKDYLKLKIEDAVFAAKAAWEEGIVPGGGQALKSVAQKMGKGSILYHALMAPYEKIQSNAGKELEIPKNIVDPLKVERLALENACSAVGKLITIETVIAERRESLWDELDKKLSPGDRENDFRDKENQDLGAGRQVE